ncbi:hypothetical protein JST97_14530 [bacterium]|nr:hypothetical protein [bacterium]
MANTNIPSTLIATNQPLNIASSQAIPYFPGFAINFAASSSGTILSVAPTILLWNFQADAGWSFFAGLAGPSIALNYTAAGAYDGNRIALNVSNDEIQGGILFGVNVADTGVLEMAEVILEWPGA